MEQTKETSTGLEIAVIGMAGRFPGANHIREFQDNLKKGIESIPFLSDRTLQTAGVAGELKDNPHYIKTGGGLVEAIEYFDAVFFGYTPQEVEVMAPQARIFHECVWNALEDAGCDPARVDGAIGVYAGASTTGPWERLTEFSSAHTELNPFILKYLSDGNFLGALISYKLDLKGPVVSMQTTCSTSLVAIHLACQGLLSGDCDMALAGGVAISYKRDKGYLYEEGMILSPDGHCRTFDAAAGGTIGGDGAGVVVLKRLEEAIEHRDYIYAVIKGSAVNNDGIRKVGFTAPSIEGQAEVIRKAHEMAAVNPEDITYVEAHGTATPLGDLTEIEALKAAFNTDKKHFCALGSVKTNVGHLDTAAGVAGLIKTVLALKSGQIPPSLHFENPNPSLGLENSPFYVNRGLKEWKPNGKPLRAGVSSFGIGGTNAHVILEEAPNTPGTEDTPPSRSRGNREYQLLLLSAKTQSALDKITENFVEFLKKNPGINLADTAYTLQTGRRRFQYRRKLVCPGIPETIRGLSFPAAKNLPDPKNSKNNNLPDPKTTKIIETRNQRTSQYHSNEENKPVIFMFPGLDSQYEQMGLRLYQTEPVFRREMDNCVRILQEMAGIDLKEILYPPRCSDGNVNAGTDPGKIHRTEISQYVVFSFEYSLAKLLMSWGLNPRAMIGYSFGEYTAACLSGVFSLENALHLLVSRGNLIRGLPAGVMLSVPLAREEIRPFLTDEIAIAVDNGPSCVVSGPVNAVNAFEKRMKEKKLVCRRLNSMHAVHSPMMDPILGLYEKHVRTIPLHPPRIPYISGVTGNWITAGDATTPGYWAKQLRETVRFAEGIQRLLKEPGAICLEVGPGRDISALVRRQLDQESGHRVINLVRQPGKEIPDDEYLLDRIGLLWLYGGDIDWAGYYRGEARRHLPLPGYPFASEGHRFWQMVDDYKAGRFEDVAPGQVSTGEGVGDWFYVPSWRRKKILGDGNLNSNNHDSHNAQTGSAVSEDSSHPFNWLIFADSFGLAEDLATQLKNRHQQVIIVRKGTDFTKQCTEQCSKQPAEQHTAEYTVNPQQFDDYKKLFAGLRTDNSIPHRIIHLWGLTENQPPTSELQEQAIEESQACGFYSLLYLAKIMGENIMGESPGNRGKIQVNVITGNMQEVTGDEVLHPGKATVMGPCKVIPQEYPHLECRSIDVIKPQSGNWQDPELIRHLITEMTHPMDDRTVAFRGGRRLVQVVDHLGLDSNEKSPLLRQGGVYLITGGLGNIGSALAGYLMEHYQASVILTGRSPIPPRQTWGQALIVYNEDDKLNRDIRKLQQLEELGDRLLYYSADIADRMRMQEVIREAEAQFGPINGIIHCAGIIAGESLSPINEITPSQCQLQFQAKLYGLLVLEELCRDKNLDFCLLVSSISTILGGLGFVAYSAANHFIDAFSKRYNQKNREPWIILDWDGTTPEDTVKAFDLLLSSSAIEQEQVIFSKGGDLQGRISRWIKLETMGKQNRNKGAPGSKPAPTLLYTRPELSNPYEAPATAMEQQLADIWQRFFGIEKIGVNDDLFDLGGDSLKAVNILAVIHKELNVTIPIKEFFNNPTIREVARYLSGAEKEEHISIEPAEEKEYYVLSSGQELIYILQQMIPDSTAYNTPIVNVLEGNVDIGKLETTFKRVIKRHEGLRTSFVAINNQPVQRIHREVEFQIEFVDISATSEPADNVITGFIRPFSLDSAPLFRTGLIKVEENKHILMFDIHHIITDGVSHDILVQDFMWLYSGKDLPPLVLQYRDFSQWQTSERCQESLKSQEEYWLNEFQGDIPRLNLPGDFGQSGFNRFAGSTSGFEIPAGDFQRLKALAKEEDATVFMVLLALFNVLFSRLSGQEDIIIGTFSAGRRHADLGQIIGMFANTLALRNYPRGDKTFIRFLEEIKTRLLDSFENQDYPFALLVDRVEENRDLNRNPLFDVCFVLQQVGTGESPLENESLLKLKPYTYHRNTTQFDLHFIGVEKEETLDFNVIYNRKQFKAETVDILTGLFREILKSILDNPWKTLNEIRGTQTEKSLEMKNRFNENLEME